MTRQGVGLCLASLRQLCTCRLPVTLVHSATRWRTCCRSCTGEEQKLSQKLWSHVGCLGPEGQRLLYTSSGPPPVDSAAGTMDSTDAKAGTSEFEKEDFNTSVKNRKHNLRNKTRINKKLHNRILSPLAEGDTDHGDDFMAAFTEEDTFGNLKPALQERRMSPKSAEENQRSREKTGVSYVFDIKHQRKSSMKQSHGEVSLDEDEWRGDSVSQPAWEDTFGTMADDPRELGETTADIARHDEEDDEISKPFLRLSDRDRKNSPWWYGLQIEKLAKRGKIAEAIAVLETKMLKEDRVMPTRYVFTVLIGALGRVGYSKKAFQLFNKMKKMGLQPEDPTYTALFNACSNSPWKEDGLQRARGLWQLITEKGYQPNSTTYKAMIKAFGVCGDIETAFLLVDEMQQAGIALDTEVYSFLLMACISDTQAGFRHAILVWRMMRKKKLKPTIYQYNLLLRAARDCKIGDPQLANQLLGKGDQGADKQNQWDTTSRESVVEKDSIYPLHVHPVSDEKVSQSIRTDQSEPSTQVIHTEWWQYKESSALAIPQDTVAPKGASIVDMEVPNILNPRGKFRQVISLGELKYPSDRLALLGGLPGILGHMMKDKVSPDIKTFCLLLGSMARNQNAESDLLAAMQVHRVKPNLNFLNQLIRARNLRQDYHGAKEVLSMMTELELEPDMQTFGCLAMGCTHKQDGLQLLTDMEDLDLEPNVVIYGILVRRSGQDFRYKWRICHHMSQHKVAPSEAFLQTMEADISVARRNIVRQERGQPVEDLYLDPQFKKDFKEFMVRYQHWLQNMKIHTPAHPWEQFLPSTETQENSEHGGDQGTAV